MPLLCHYYAINILLSCYEYSMNHVVADAVIVFLF